MLRSRNKNTDQLSLVDEWLPKSYFSLPDELEKVDKLLSDERFIEPFAKHFSRSCGRPSTPIDVYLRMMYLKRRYGLGYERLCKEVADSITWRRFCHIRLEDDVPDFTTLAKLTKKFGDKALEELNDLLIHKAVDEKLIRSRKVRVDSTVVQADIHHPTDARLLSDGVRVLTRIVKKIKQAGSAIGAKFRDRTRSVKKRLLSITKFSKRRTDQAKAEVMTKVKEIAAICREVIGQAEKVSTMTRTEIPRKGASRVSKVERLVTELDSAISVVKKVIFQTDKVIRGMKSIPERVVSIFDQGARPIRRGKERADTEFGRKVFLAESEEKLIVSYKVLEGNPADRQEAVPMAQKVQSTLGRSLDEFAADRGFHSNQNEAGLEALGIKHVAIPKPGKCSAKRKEIEGASWFKRLRRWRSGGEATISLLKRKYGLNRCLFKGSDGTAAWVGISVFTHNVDKLVALMT